MNVTEKVTYLKGLADGLQFGQSSMQGQVLSEILGVLEDISQKMNVLEFDIDILDRQMYKVDGRKVIDEYKETFGVYEGEIYEIICPLCQESVLLDEDDLNKGELDCYGCGTKLEIDFSAAVK